jgi:CheY-like chemotaxis protein
MPASWTTSAVGCARADSRWTRPPRARRGCSGRARRNTTCWSSTACCRAATACPSSERCAGKTTRRRSLILSALGEVDDRVTGLRAGGDDYLVKPYAFTELAGAHRGAAAPDPPGRGGDQAAKSADWSSTGCRTRSARRRVDLLQPREFRLLEYLMKHAGQVVTRTMLLENVWDYHFDPQTNVIDVHMSRLRQQDRQGPRQAAAAHRARRRIHAG